MNLTASERKLDADRVLQGLLRPLATRRRLAPEELEGLLRGTFERLLLTVQGEAALVFRRTQEGQARLSRVYRSPSLALPELSNPGDELFGGSTAVRLDPACLAERDLDLLELRTYSGAQVAPPWAMVSATRSGFSVRCSILVPLVENGECLGALLIVNKSGEGLFSLPDFSAGDLDLVEEVARHALPALARTLEPACAREFTEEEVARFVARLARLEHFEIPVGWKPDLDLLARVGPDFLRVHLAIPIERTSANGVTLAMANPFDVVARDAFRSQTSLEVEKTVVAASSAIRQVLLSVFPDSKDPSKPEDMRRSHPGAGGISLDGTHSVEGPHQAENTEESDGIIRLANKIIEDAHADGASDIHIEPFENEVKIRFRVDGCLKEVASLPAQVCRALVSRIKIMTRSMDITENRLPQDGRIKFKQFSKNGTDIDLRVSTAPLAFGQKTVLRLLDKGNTALGLDKMGFGERNLRTYREMIQKPYGMVLHVGPTGSGKTTTLYSALSEINKPDVNIQTAEDPIEYMLPNVNHMQMQKEIGLTFAAALRCFLRQDPDIILVGEIRDIETAEIAVEAALTGHLIFSTMHTNDAPGTVSRFIEMGVEPFLVSSSLLVVCAQRLMRRLCVKCKTQSTSTPYECRVLGLPGPQPIFRANLKGCDHCRGAGYKGRIGVHEVMTLNEPMKALIASEAQGQELREAAISNGMISLYDDAMEKVLKGITSIEEALTVVRKE